MSSKGPPTVCPSFGVRRILLLCLSAATVHGATNSGGSTTTVGTLRNTSSIGSPFATGLGTIGPLSNRSGLIPVLFPLHTLAPSADSDGDGLPDSWELANGFDPNTSNPTAGDTDGDGLTDIQEFIAGTNPRSVASRFQPSAVLDPGGLRLDFPTVAGRTYRLESTPDFSTWSKVEDIPGDGTPKTRIRPVPSGPDQKLFYRLRVILNP